MMPRPRDRPVLTRENEAGLKLCIASAWLYGSISRGRAAELARAMGWPFSAIENLKFVEERNRFTEADFDAQQKTPQPEGQGVD
jgi:hypothetical protein